MICFNDLRDLSDWPKTVIDVEVMLGDMGGRRGKFHGFYDCTVLAGAVSGGSLAKTSMIADNYAMWALTAALPDNDW